MKILRRVPTRILNGAALWSAPDYGWGVGTNRYRLGVAGKTIQAILRHANVSTTNTYYIKSAADDTRVAMAKLERLVIGDEPPTEAEQHDFVSGNEVATKAADANPAAIQ